MELLFEGTWEHIRKEMQAVLGHSTVVVSVDNAVTVEKLVTSDQAQEKTKATKAPTKAATPPVSAPVTVKAPVEATGFDFKKIEEIIPKALEAAGRGKVVTLLEKYGAKKGSELKSADYEAFYNECQGLITASSLT